MTAYVLIVVDKEIDSEKMHEYRLGARDSLIKHKGKLLTLPSSKKLAVEGEDAETIIIVEFPTMEAAQGWYYSDDYQVPAKIRQAATVSRGFIIEGANISL